MAGQDRIFWKSLKNAFMLRCPRCGEGRILKSWFSNLPSCPVCRLVYEKDPVDLGMFMYVSTAAVTGLFLIGYFLIGFPTNGWARVWVAVSGLGLMVLTAPIRRCVGIALLYVADVIF